jgi:DNA-binding transcriptional MerR regulator
MLLCGWGIRVSTHYHIGKFADFCGVSAKNLRFYDEIGVLRPASVDPRTGYRQYLPQQLEQMASIIALKNLGVPLVQVREFTTKSSRSADRRAILNNLKRQVEQSIQTARQSLNWINASLNELDKGQSPISVIVKRRPAVRVASVRIMLRNYAEVARFESELSAALPPGCVGTLRGVLWHRCADSGSLEAEPFIELKKRAPLRPPYEMKEIPQATLACAYSGIGDESAEQAYVAVRRWMQIRGYRLAGPKREIYLQNMLEIQFPLAS